MAAPAFRASLGVRNVGTAGVDDSSDTISITAAAGDSLVIVTVFRHSSPGATVTGVQFNGAENATLLASSDNTGGGTVTRLVTIWGLLVPTATTANIVATYSTTIANGRHMQVFAYTGVDSFGAVTDSITGLGTALSINLDTNRADSLAFAAFGQADSASDPYTPDDTERSDGQTGAGGANDCCFTTAESAAASPGTVTLSTTGSASNQWWAAAAEIRSAIANAAGSGLTNSILLEKRRLVA